LSKLPRVNAKQIEKILLKLGYVQESGKGSHSIYRKSGKIQQVTVPYHGSRILKLSTFKSILNQAGLTVEEFTNLL
jgi:predicted RNA binding protein YcfA (HicA-like mRNA interferase family)